MGLTVPNSGRLEVAIATVVLLCLGAISAFIVPPCQTPDEGFSFLRAYHVSEGHLWPEMVGPWGGGHFPPGVVKIVADSTRLIHRPDEKFTFAEWRELSEQTLDGEPRSVEYITAAPYTFVPFLPQAVGIRIARAVGGGPLSQFYAGRLGNLVFGVALIAAALAFAPVGRRFFAMIAMLPMSVHLLGSYAPEVGVIGASLLIPAIVLRLAMSERRAAWWELAIFLAAIAWIAAAKPPYLPIAAFLLAIPAVRFGGQLRRAAFLALAFALGGVIGIAGVEATRSCYPDPNTLFGFEASVKQQTAFLKQHPEQFALAYGEATVVRAVPTWFRLFKLGWLDVTIDSTTIVLYTLALVLMAVAGRAEILRNPVSALETGFLERPETRFPKQKPGFKTPRWPAALVIFAGSILLVLSLYLWSAPVGSSTASLHGRYLLPLLSALLFVMPTWQPGFLKSAELQRRIAWWATGIMTAAAFAAIVSRYYLESPPLLFRGPTMTLLGVMLGIVMNGKGWIVTKFFDPERVALPAQGEALGNLDR